MFAELPEACDNTLGSPSDVELRPELERIARRRRDRVPPAAVRDAGGRAARRLPARSSSIGARPSATASRCPRRSRERIEHELAVIVQMGFAGYFLIVWDLIRFAREQGIRVGPGRGSAAGSVVSYFLRITDLDPLRYGLLFERFLNPERIEMPDIDMDFDERRRDEVIRYATERYGADHVAQIVTFQTIKGKQGIRDAARVLGFPPASATASARCIRRRSWAATSRSTRALEISPGAARGLRDASPRRKEIIDTARALEGLRREDSVHAAGVVIGDAPLVNYLPLKLTKDSRDDSKKIVTQFDMNGVEQLGLLKMDFLGLRNLSVIEETLRHLRSARASSSTSTTCRWTTTRPTRCSAAATRPACSRWSRPGCGTSIKLLEPDRFEDLMALVALYRPGPLDDGSAHRVRRAQARPHAR